MQDALHRCAIYADAERSGGFDDHAKALLRESIHTVFADSLEAAGITAPEYIREDRGDGLLITVEASVPEVRLAGFWIIDVNERLRQLNRGRRNPLRMRIGMNSGPVRRDAHGVSGTAVDAAARMANSDAARDALAAVPGASLAVFVGDSFYRSVILGGDAYIEADLYHPITLRTRSLDATIWAYVPRMGLPKGEDAEVESGPRAVRAVAAMTDEPDAGAAGPAGADATAAERARSVAGNRNMPQAPAAPAPQVTNTVENLTGQLVVFGINNAPAPGEPDRG